MIRRLAPAFRGMSAFYTNPETLAPLFNDRGELADDNDVDKIESRPDVVAAYDRLALAIAAEDRLMGKKLSDELLHAELEAFLCQPRRLV